MEPGKQGGVHPGLHRRVSRRLREHPATPRWWAVVLGVEAVLLLGYFVLTPARMTQLRYVLYPFVWINAGLAAVTYASPPSAPRRRRALAGTLAAGYLLALLWVAGLVGATAHPESGGFGVRVAMASPGWGPVVTYLGPTVHATFVPFRALGYLALAYLVYVRTLQMAGAVVSGVVGFASCISCSFSVVASLVAGVAGGTSAAAVIYSFSIDVSTAVFLLAVAVLYWGPRFGSR